MIHDQILPCIFKGDRNYLHATDIFDSLSDIAKEYSGFLISLVFRRFARSKVKLIFTDFEKASIVAEVKFRLPDEVLSGYIVETGNPVEGRREYDEGLIQQKCTLDLENKNIYLDAIQPFTKIEIIVSMTKYLHNQSSSVSGGKWVFGRIDLSNPLPVKVSTFCVRTVQMVGEKFSINEVLINGLPIGTIRFIRSL